MSRSNPHPFLKAIPFVVALLVGVRPLASQQLTEQAFISNVTTAIQPFLPPVLEPKQPIIMGANLEYAGGPFIASQNISDLMDYVDGLKAVGVQRIEINPGYLSLQDPAVMAQYDAVVEHIRQLGLQLAINTVVVAGQANGTNFTEFQAAAVPGIQQIAARYQPDNLVIVHEPDTMNSRLLSAPSNFSAAPTVADWDGFVRQAAQLVKQVSPHTRVGAGCYYASPIPNTTEATYVANEQAYFTDFATIPELDFLTMDIYDDTTFSQFQQWAQLAQSSGKGAYIEETWIPHYLANGLPANWNGSNLDTESSVGPCSSDFASLYGPWIQAMSLFASNNGMESVTIFSTPAFFAYGSGGADEPEEASYAALANSALQKGQLTSAGQAYLSASQQLGIKIATSLSSASYATLPSVFCSSNPCNANATVAPDELVSTYGADLASSRASPTSATLPTVLGGTSATLVDSSGASYPVPLAYVSPTQINYLVPSAAKPGGAVLTIVSGDATITTGWVLVAGVNPGLYTASATGKGAPAAFAVCAGPCTGWPGTANQYGQFLQEIFSDCGAAGGCKTVPINLGSASDSVVLELFGTGIRHVASTASVTATINGQTVPVLFAGAQGQFPGEDQINVEIPHSLAGSGTVNVVLTTTVSASDLAAYDSAGTSSSNTVTIDIE